ncbi:MAG: histidinol-phosphate transaminase [Kiritimatiellae bacterium]|nr:histidinol-phosphate transaminase [Kiritimatiellia bacterium]
MSELIRESIRAMTGYTPGEQPGRREVIKLNTNENPYPPSPRVRKLLKDFNADDLRLYPDPVCARLRERLAELHGCGADQVFVGNGSDDILALCVRAFVERDGTVGWFDPSYSLYPVLARIEDVATRPVPLGPEFEWSMPDDYKASLFFLTNPNAPTGILYPKRNVADFCARFPGVVLIDEAYVDFASYHCMDLALERPNVIVARTLSKSCSLAGIRLGYAVGPAELIAAFLTIKDSYNVSALTQEIGLAALSDRAHMEANIERIRIERRRSTAELEKRGFKVYPSESNYLWVRLEGITAKALYEHLRADKVFVRYFPGGRTDDFLRISVGTEGEMTALFGAIDRILGAMS